MDGRLSRAQTIGRQVRAALAEHGVTQQELAACLGLTHTAVSNRVAGRVSFRGDELMQIAELLNERPERFFRQVSQRRPSSAAAARRVPA